MLLLEEMDRAQQDVSSPDKKPSFAIDSAIKSARGLRVAISGSMACPVSILNRWHALTGQSLLERYGMTELGMVLTNPLHGERHFGYVGGTFPSVSVRLVDPDTEQEVELSSEKEGELRVKGPAVFKEYWKKPESTAKEFDEEGWFKTGDIVQYNNEHASFRIRGRASADIIKSAGYKISALDIERVLLTHPEVQECAVFGVPDEKWGQIVAAVVRTSSPEIESQGQCSPPLVEFMKSHLADYRVPRKYFFVAEIPKNAMGKVNKKSLASIFSEK
jgi:malonyl-CoA/methylmalonyl-CoA synthetase